jgi:hypothetical protein
MPLAYLLPNVPLSTVSFVSARQEESMSDLQTPHRGPEVVCESVLERKAVNIVVRLRHRPIVP